MRLIINPGSGPVEGDCTIDNAYENMRAFMRDSGLPETDFHRNCEDDSEGDGRFSFLVKDHDGEEVSVLMPGLPLERVRFFNKPEQNILHFPRLYVRGNSWIWCYGLLRKEDGE